MAGKKSGTKHSVIMDFSSWFQESVMVTGSDTVTVSIVALYNYHNGQCDICLDFFFNCFCQVLNKKLVLQHNYLNAELNQPFKSNNKASRSLMVEIRLNVIFLVQPI